MIVLVAYACARTRGTNTKHESRKEAKNELVNESKEFDLGGLASPCLLGTTSVTSALEVGEKAPDFKLPSTNGVDISLSDFKGKKFVFLEFYGAAFVPT
jgi:AhpC/TSA family